MKKLVAGIMAFCVFAGAVPVNSVKFVDNSITASAKELGVLTYEKSSDYVVITGCDKSVESVNIPAEIEGLPVTAIGEIAFYCCSALTEITIPDSVTYTCNFLREAKSHCCSSSRHR